MRHYFILLILELLGSIWNHGNLLSGWTAFGWMSEFEIFLLLAVCHMVWEGEPSSDIFSDNIWRIYCSPSIMIPCIRKGTYWSYTYLVSLFSTNTTVYQQQPSPFPLDTRSMFYCFMVHSDWGHMRVQCASVATYVVSSVVEI